MSHSCARRQSGRVCPMHVMHAIGRATSRSLQLCFQSFSIKEYFFFLGILFFPSLSLSSSLKHSLLFSSLLSSLPLSQLSMCSPTCCGPSQFGFDNTEWCNASLPTWVAVPLNGKSGTYILNTGGKQGRERGGEGKDDERTSFLHSRILTW